MIVRFELTDSGFRCLDAPVLANTASINYLRAKFIIKDKTWDDVTAITAVFKSATYNKVSEVLLDSDRSCFIDPEIYKNGGNIQCQIVGDKYLNGQILSSTHLTQVTSFYIKENVIVPTPIPSKYEVVVAELERAEEAVEAIIELVQTKLENGDFDGEDGEDGVGIASVTYNQDGTLTITLTDGTEIISSYSMKGEKGDTGNGIASVVYGEDGTLVITMTDGTQFESEYSMKGEKGEPGDNGEKGDPGNGIASIAKTSTSGLVDTYTVTFDDGTATTFTVTNGAKGDRGERGYTGVGIDDIDFNSDYSMTISLDDGSTYDSPVLRGEKGETGEKGDPGTTDYNDLENKPFIPSLTSDLENDSRFIKAVDTASGAIATFKDAFIKKLTADINPVQDLHGYDKPWVGGNGKNKLPLTVDGIKSMSGSGTWSGNSYTHNGITYTIETDSDGNVTDISANGTATGFSFIRLASVNSLSGNFKISGAKNGSEYVYIRNESTNTTLAEDRGSGADVTLSATSDFVTFILGINQGTGVTNEKFYPMLRLASETDASFEPYSNICPISGWDEAEVSRTGKNLYDKTQLETNTAVIIGQIDDGITITSISSGTFKSAFYEVEGKWSNRKVYFSANITNSGTNNGGISIRPFDANGNEITGNRLDYFVTNGSVMNKTFPQGTKKLRIIAYGTYSNSASANDVATIKNAMLSFDDVSYKPYNGNTYIISLGGTRYGAHIDVTSGVMVVDREISVLDGSETWGQGSGQYADVMYVSIGAEKVNSVPISNQFKGLVAQAFQNLSVGEFAHQANATDVSYNFKTTYTSISDWKTYLASNNLQIVRHLATPLTVQLTPTQIEALLGTNNVWASTGEVAIELVGVPEMADKIPFAPTTDGTYTLKVTVTDGEAAYSWVADE